MKKYLFILIILIFAGCTKRQRNDRMVYVYNSTVPEILPFELDAQTILPEGDFDPDIPDSTKMNRLDKEATVQLLKIKNKVYNEHDIQLNSVYNWADSIFYNTCRFYIYGKLDLQSNVKSFVIWEFDEDFDFGTHHSKSLWLFNLKDDKLCSVVLLATSFATLIDRAPGVDKTSLKANVFTTIYKTTDYISFWVDPVAAYKQRRETVDLIFTHYKVNENGFIEFVDK